MRSRRKERACFPVRTCGTCLLDEHLQQQQQTRESSLVHHPALPLAFPDRTTLNSGIVLSVSEMQARIFRPLSGTDLALQKIKAEFLSYTYSGRLRLGFIIHSIWISTALSVFLYCAVCYPLLLTSAGIISALSMHVSWLDWLLPWIRMLYTLLAQTIASVLLAESLSTENS